jgi:hypothetical protein
MDGAIMLQLVFVRKEQVLISELATIQGCWSTEAKSQRHLTDDNFGQKAIGETANLQRKSGRFGNADLL